MITSLVSLRSINDQNGKSICVRITNDSNRESTIVHFTVCGKPYESAPTTLDPNQELEVCIVHQESGICLVTAIEPKSDKKTERYLDLNAASS